jgi:hypothetical protein
MQKLVTASVVLAAAGLAQATTLAPGDFVFTQSFGTNDSSIEFFDWDTDGITQLVYDGPGRRLGGFDTDNAGNFWIVDFPIPLVAPSASNMYNFASGPLFAPLSGGSQASFSNITSSGGDLRAAGEGVYDAASGQVLYANNNQNLGADPVNAVHAVLGVNVNTGAQQRIVEETDLDIFNNIPNFLQLSGISNSPVSAYDYVFASVNGGRIVGTSTQGVGSTLWGLNGVNAPGTETFIKDFTDADVVAAIGRELTFVGTIANIPGTNDLLMSDAGLADGVQAGGVYRVELDDATGAYVGISKVLDATDYADLGAAGDIVYNEFTGRWILSNLEFNGLGQNQILSFELSDPAGSLIVEADNIRAGNFVVVPTPGAVGVLGLAGLTALRRRR